MELRKRLAAARKIWGFDARARALLKLSSEFEGEQRKKVLEEAVAAARKIKHLDYRIWILQSLAQDFRGKQKKQVLDEVIVAVRKIKALDARARALVKLSSEFDSKQRKKVLEEAFVAARRIEDKDSRAHVLEELSSEFDGEQRKEVLEEAFDAARGIKYKDSRARMLVKLALKFDGEQRKKVLEEAFAAARGIKSNASRAWALQRLAPQFVGKRKKQALKEAFSAAREIKDLTWRAFVLQEIALQFRNKHIKQELNKALSAKRRILGKRSRTNKARNRTVIGVGRRILLGKGSRSKNARKNSMLGAAHRKPNRRVKTKIGVDKYYKIYFTAYHPKVGSVESWHTLLVYTHIASMLAKVRSDVNKFDDQIKSPKETTSESSTSIARGTELTIVPSCESVTFNPERFSFKWMEDFHRADFRFKADKSLSGDAAKGSIDIYVGPLIIGTLKFAMLFNEKDTQPVPDHEEHAKIYGKDDVFISYSRKDSEIARTFKTILEGTGLDVFLDVDDIRSGQLWEDELKRRIKRAQIFQIFWSTNYSQSENCKQEWEYALKQNKDEGYIRPVYWEKPLSPNRLKN